MSTPRAKPSGRRPGDSGTRTAIADTARRQFSEQGYDRTSIRGIAAEAGVDPALVTHFYGSKQKLFVLVAELPHGAADVLREALAADPSSAGHALARFIAGALEHHETRERLLGLVRAAASEPEAARLIRERLAAELLQPVAEHLGADQPALRAAFLASQTVGLVMARHVVALEPLAAADADVLVRGIAPVYQRYLTEPL
jgi:AcrR family transcriptional regulator